MEMQTYRLRQLSDDSEVILPVTRLLAGSLYTLSSFDGPTGTVWAQRDELGLAKAFGPTTFDMFITLDADAEHAEQPEFVCYVAYEPTVGLLEANNYNTRAMIEDMMAAYSHSESLTFSYLLIGAENSA